jgi:hypothetical protein
MNSENIITKLTIETKNIAVRTIGSIFPFILIAAINKGSPIIK